MFVIFSKIDQGVIQKPRGQKGEGVPELSKKVLKEGEAIFKNQKDCTNSKRNLKTGHIVYRCPPKTSINFLCPFFKVKMV